MAAAWQDFYSRYTSVLSTSLQSSTFSPAIPNTRANALSQVLGGSHREDGRVYEVLSSCVLYVQIRRTYSMRDILSPQGTAADIFLNRSYSCHQGEKCSNAAFKKELSCPLCDTVLPKDGIGSVILMPDSTDIKKAGSRIYGFQPQQMCEVLKLGLEFWAKQKQNETLLHERELSSTHRRMTELEEQNAKLTRALNEERLKRNSVQNEKEVLQKTVSDLEARYAQKARSMRKLTELYNELRQVHRRLEADLRGVRDANDFDVDAVPGSEFEVNTHGVSGNMSVREGKGSYRGNDEEVERSAREPEIVRDRRRASREYNDRDPVHHDEGSNSVARRISAPGDVLFNFTTNRSPTSNIKVSVPAKNVGNRGGRRRLYHIDPRPEEESSHPDRRA